MHAARNGWSKASSFFVALLSFFALGWTIASGEEASLLHKPAETDPLWSVFVFGGMSAEAKNYGLVGLMVMPWSATYGRNDFAGGAVSRRMGRLDSTGFVFDFEVGGGERWGKNFSSSEEWFALYVRYDRFPWNHVLFTTVGLNTGLNYVEKVSPVELDSCIGKGNPNCARLLHNLSPEITFASPKNPNSEFVIRWHHRSGIWGLMDNVWGGSNTLTGGFRQRF